MVPMSKRRKGAGNSSINLHGSRASAMNQDDENEEHFKLPKTKKDLKDLDDVQRALQKEISIFTKRERLLQDFKVNYLK
ncbi:hypothetical protein AC249_AIPGENE24987 [Exaiptasia diaphana]|nr:hypothetical protein AC249_AIPGENE24987 [Exaiptasia diaphana]